MSLSSELIFDCIRFLRGNFKACAESVFAPKQRRSLLGGYQAHDALMPSSFFEIFQKKKSDNFVETNRTSERFF
jgi:hypothetical protein